MTEITSIEIKRYMPALGRVSATELISGYKNALFRDITPPELLAGITLTEKLFVKIDNSTSAQGVNVRHFLGDISPGGSRSLIYPGTQRNQVADLTGSERKYGAGRLSADVLASAVSIIVDVEPGNGAESIYQVGDEVRLFNATNKEFAIIDTVSAAGDQYTIGLVDGLLHSYAAADPTVISSCIKDPVIECIVDNFAQTSVGDGDYDIATSSVTTDNIGTIEQTWVGTFTSTTDYTLIGDTVGSVGTGNKGANFSPVNPDFSRLYLSILAAGFSGAHQIGDTFTFQTHPAAKGLFVDLIIDVSTTSYSNDNIKINTYVESA